VAKNGFFVFDCDMHLEEPFDLWERRLPEPWRSRTKIVPPPRGHLETGRAGIEVGGNVSQPLIFGPAVSEVAEEAFQRRNPTTRQSERKWLEVPHLVKAQTECSPEVYLEGMEIEGIDIAVLTPSFIFRLTSIDGLDPEHAIAMCRVHNDYAAEFAGADPQRFKFWAWLPRGAPEQAAREARRCVEELGAVGVAMTNQAVDGRLLSDPEFDALWTEAERLHTVVGIHPATPRVMRDDFRSRYNGHRRTDVVGTTMRPFYAQSCIAELILGGVLEEHPALNVMIMESDATWVPWLLWRMDGKWETYGPDQDYQLSLKPSDYFRRQCFVAADPGEEVVKYVIDQVGDDRVVWASDYPHHDCPFPEATSTFLALEGISEESKRKMLWDNAARLFGIDARRESAALVS